MFFNTLCLWAHIYQSNTLYVKRNNKSMVELVWWTASQTQDKCGFLVLFPDNVEVFAVSFCTAHCGKRQIILRCGILGKKAHVETFVNWSHTPHLQSISSTWLKPGSAVFIGLFAEDSHNFWENKEHQYKLWCISCYICKMHTCALLSKPSLAVNS